MPYQKAYDGPVKVELLTEPNSEGAYSVLIECPTLGTHNFEKKTLAECVAAIARAYEDWNAVDAATIQEK